MKVAELVLRYVTVGEEIEQRTLTVPVVLNLVSADEAAAQEPDLQVREEVLRLSAAKARADAIELADAGHYADAQNALRGVASDLRAAGLTNEADALEADQHRVSRVAYRSEPANRKNLRYDSRNRGR